MGLPIPVLWHQVLKVWKILLHHVDGDTVYMRCHILEQGLSLPWLSRNKISFCDLSFYRPLWWPSHLWLRLSLERTIPPIKLESSARSLGGFQSSSGDFANFCFGSLGAELSGDILFPTPTLVPGLSYFPVLRGFSLLLPPWSCNGNSWGGSSKSVKAWISGGAWDAYFSQLYSSRDTVLNFIASRALPVSLGHKITFHWFYILNKPTGYLFIYFFKNRLNFCSNCSGLVAFHSC